MILFWRDDYILAIAWPISEFFFFLNAVNFAKNSARGPRGL